MKMENWYQSTVNQYRLEYQSKKIEVQLKKCQRS